MDEPGKGPLEFQQAVLGVVSEKRLVGRVTYDDYERTRSIVRRPWRRTDEGRMNVLEEVERRFVEHLVKEGHAGEIEAARRDGKIDWRKLRDLIIKYLPTLLQIIAFVLTLILAEDLDPVSG